LVVGAILQGEIDVLPGIRLLPAPGHTDGHQVVVVETGAVTNVLGGDVAVWFGEFGNGTTEGQRRVLALGAPTWLSHAPGPKIPETSPVGHGPCVDLISTRTVVALGWSCSRSQLRLIFTSLIPPLAVMLGSGAANPGSRTASWLNGGRCSPGLWKQR
jgi:hypothetical protein